MQLWSYTSQDKPIKTLRGGQGARAVCNTEGKSLTGLADGFYIMIICGFFWGVPHSLMLRSHS